MLAPHSRSYFIDGYFAVQAKHWSCLRGLVPAESPFPSARLAYRQIPGVNTFSAVVPMSDPVQPFEELQQAPSQVVMANSIEDTIHGHAACTMSSLEQQSRKAAQAKAWPQSAKDLYLAGGHQADTAGSSEDGTNRTLPPDRTPVHAESQLHAPVGPVSYSAAVHAHTNSQPAALPTRGSVVPSSNANAGAGMQPPVPDSKPQIKHDSHDAEHVADPALTVHDSVADESSKHGHRLLAEGQEAHSHAAKAAHRAKPLLPVCQSKSHQRLLLMTALHVSAHKQMRRQHKCTHAGAHETAAKR